MPEGLKKFLTKYSWLTHAIGVGLLSLTSIYASDATFSTYVNTTALELYRAMPKWMAQFVIGFVVPIFLTYRTGLSNKGKVMVAKDAVKEDGGTLVHKIPAIIFAAMVMRFLR